MAKMSINYLLVILIFASPFGVIFAVPTAESSNLLTLDECRKYFSVKCELEVSKSIFKEAVVSDGCCYLLVSLGKQCHDLFVNEAIASRPNVDKSQALAMSKQIWEQCLASIAPPTRKH